MMDSDISGRKRRSKQDYPDPQISGYVLYEF